MGFLSRLIGGDRRPMTPQSGGMRAAFPAADLGRLTHSWTIDPGAINRWLRFELRILRSRMRQLARADAYAAKFLRACENNIAGPAPFVLMSKVHKGRPTVAGTAPELDRDANRRLEQAWARWSLARNCDVTGRMSLPAMYRLIIRCLARDGEVLVRYLRGRQFGPFGLQLQILDIDRLDEERNEENVRGGAIKMGVQLNAYGKPTAYHLLRRNPGEYGLWGPANPRDYEVIPADQVVHLYVPDWPEQVRGFPWAHAAMTRLYHLGGFEEAAVVAARVGAAQMGMLERDPEVSGAASLASAADTESAAGEPQITVEAGTFQAIPYGWRMAEGWNPKYPDAAVEPFIRSTLRGIAASVGMAYHSLANDPSNVNFSTARVALLEERDMWASLQAWFVEHFCLPLFEEWRSMAALSGQLPQEYTGERFGEVRFQPRRWQWVDPRNEAAAQVEALEAKLTSRTRIAAQQGEDIEEIFDEIAAEEQMAADAGVTLTPAAPQPEPPPSPAAPEDDEPSEEDENGKSRPRLAVG